MYSVKKDASDWFIHKEKAWNTKLIVNSKGKKVMVILDDTEEATHAWNMAKKHKHSTFPDQAQLLSLTDETTEALK